MASSPDAGAFARLRAAVGARLSAVRALRLRLHDDWKRLLLRAWSVRFILFAGACEAVSAACSFFTDNPPIDRSILSAIAAFCTIAAVVARLIPQKNLGADA